jgi:hypothetical protein
LDTLAFYTHVRGCLPCQALPASRVTRVTCMWSLVSSHPRLEKMLSCLGGFFRHIYSIVATV